MSNHREESKASRIYAITEKTGLIIERISGAWCVICFAAMTVVAILGVFFRYVMQSPFMWTEEIARYLLVWLGFTAISIALRQDRHIKVEILDKMVSPLVMSILGYVVDAFIAFFFLVLLHQGYLMVANNIMSAATFPMSMAWVTAAIPVAAFLTLVQLLIGVIKKILSGAMPRNRETAP